MIVFIITLAPNKVRIELVIKVGETCSKNEATVYSIL